MQNIAGPIILGGLVVLGFALFWSRHMAYRHRPAMSDDALRLILSIAAWVCVITGFGGIILHGLTILSPIGLVVAAGVAIMLVTRYRAIERRSMLRCLSLAAQKGIPLDAAVRAFGNERTDELGLRAMRLAESLAAGCSLPDSLARSGTRLPIDALLAVRVGIETGTLSESLRRISRVDADVDLLIRSVYEKLLYLLWVWIVLMAILTFILLRIVPVFEKMFQEFGMQLPIWTQMLIQLSEWFIGYWFVATPLFLVLLFAASAGALYYVDLLPRHAPVVHRFTRGWDAALVMRVMALAVHRSWPLNKTVWLLSRIYPSSAVRRRLASAGSRIDNGENWCDSLRLVGLLRKPEWAVLQSATRVGNLEWALDEMADSSVRRLAHRLRLATNILFPITLLLFGLLVGFVVLSLFMPLVALIQGLT